MVKEKRIPNVRGMGLRDAIKLLEDMGLRVQVSGSGKVSVQSLAPGTPFRKGQEISLSLS